MNQFEKGWTGADWRQATTLEVLSGILGTAKAAHCLWEQTGGDLGRLAGMEAEELAQCGGWVRSVPGVYWPPGN
ncbi:MAG: hypothetical protein ACKO6Q_07010 [Bacteroidota bacterium]